MEKNKKEQKQQPKQTEVIMKFRYNEKGEIIGRQILQSNTVEDLEKKAPKGFFKTYEYWFNIFIEKTTNKEKELMWFLIKHRNQLSNTINLNNKKLIAKTGIERNNFNRYIKKLADLKLITETSISRVFMINPHFCYNKDYEFMKEADNNWIMYSNNNSMMEKLKISYKAENEKAYETVAKTLQNNGITTKEFLEIYKKLQELENEKNKE